MARLEGFRVRNFKVLKDITLGRLWNGAKKEALTPITAVIGKNGVGKSALFDALAFLADALKSGVEAACVARGRGGFEKIRSQGATEPIAFELCYKENGNARPITYHLVIEADKVGRPYVLQECLMQKRKGQKGGQPFSFLMLHNGIGVAWSGEKCGIQFDEKTSDFVNLLECAKSSECSSPESIELENPRKLGIATLGAFKQHPRISSLCRFIEGWYFSYFTPDAARCLPMASSQKHLNSHGDNLGNVVQFMEREHPERFQVILKKIADKIPGIDRIETEKTSDGRLLLKFNDKGFQAPFYAQQVSDGTLKLLAYFLLLEAPDPPPFLCLKEPEDGLYHRLLEPLVWEFRSRTNGSKGSSQVFVTTHQPHFVDALGPKEVWILEKGEDGFSTIRRASDDQGVNYLVEEELPLGSLWYSGYLDPREQNAL